MENLRRLALNPLCHIAILTAVVWLVFSRTLGSYFLADDFGEVSYASHIFAGDYHLLWSDFTGNFMRVPGMAVWRPWLMVSLFTDFCLWRAQATGYYLTNLLSYNLVVILFYWLVRSLSQSSGQKAKGAIAALLAAGLFAVSPLHCESVSWVVGRVDIICALFYLACLNFSLAAERSESKSESQSESKSERQSESKSESKSLYRHHMTLAVIAFWLAMWSKEMAIGAPVMVTAIYLLFGQRPFELKRALRLASPLWISTLIYFILRYLALGTLLGGYVQGIGDSQAANALSRWLDFDSVKRLLFPLAENVFGAHPWQQSCLQAFFIALALMLVVRGASVSISVRWTALIVLWALTCLAPIYKLWGLGYDLEGGRFCFFLTMPLSLMAPALILLQGKGRKLQQKLDYALCATAVLLLLATTVVLGKAAYLTDLEWVHAGQEVRQLSRQAQALAKEGVGQNILVLGIPKRRGGAHMILNGNTFTTVLRPPFTASDCSKPFVTFDPIQFSQSPFIDSSRFKRLASGPGTRVMLWQSPQRKFKEIKYLPVDLFIPELSLAENRQRGGSLHRLAGAKMTTSSASSEARGDFISLTNIAGDDTIAFDNLNLNPLAADYFEANVRVLDRHSEPVQLAVSIDDKETNFYRSKGVIGSKTTLVRVPLSKDWHWYASSTIESLYLVLPAARQIELSHCKLVRAEDVAPLLKIDSAQESYEGALTAPLHNQILDLSVNLPPLSAATTVQIEISKANTFFDSFPENDGAAAVMKKIDFPITGKEQALPINAAQLQAGTYYQMRARLRDKDGRPLGEIGNPLTLLVSSEPAVSHVAK